MVRNQPGSLGVVAVNYCYNILKVMMSLPNCIVDPLYSKCNLGVGPYWAQEQVQVVNAHWEFPAIVYFVCLFVFPAVVFHTKWTWQTPTWGYKCQACSSQSLSNKIGLNAYNMIINCTKSNIVTECQTKCERISLCHDHFLVIIQCAQNMFSLNYSNIARQKSFPAIDV